jgi:hypothetical protein
MSPGQKLVLARLATAALAATDVVNSAVVSDGVALLEKTQSVLQRAKPKVLPVLVAVHNSFANRVDGVSTITVGDVQTVADLKNLVTQLKTEATTLLTATVSAKLNAATDIVMEMVASQLTEAHVAQLKGVITRFAMNLGVGAYAPAEVDAITTVEDLMVVTRDIKATVTDLMANFGSSMNPATMPVGQMILLARLAAAAMASCTNTPGDAPDQLMDLVGELGKAQGLLDKGRQEVLPVLVAVHNSFPGNEPVVAPTIDTIDELRSLVLSIATSARTVLTEGTTADKLLAGTNIVTAIYQSSNLPDPGSYQSTDVASGYDNLKNAFSAFSDNKVTGAAVGAEVASDELSTSSAKTFKFGASLGGMSVEVTVYVFIMPQALRQIKNGLQAAASGGASFDWTSIDINFALKATLLADDFQITSLPAFSSMSDSWLGALTINGQIDLVLASADINDAEGALVIKKGFNFAGVVGDSPSMAGDAPFLASMDDASDRTSASQKYLQGYLPLDVTLGGVSYDPSLGEGWAQIGLTNYEFAPSWAEGVKVKVESAYIKVSGFGGADKCLGADNVVAKPPLTSEAECTADGSTWEPGTGLAINFNADFDLDMGEDGRVVGKFNGEYKDQNLLARGVLNRVELASMGRLTMNDAVVSLSLKRACTGQKTCATAYSCTKSWVETAHHSPGNTIDAKQPQCIEWYIVPPEAPTVDCVGIYGDWSECSATCGTGTRARQYLVRLDAEQHGEDCEAEHGELQTEECNTELCSMVNCVGEWSAYGECSSSCAGGEQTRTFYQSKAVAGGGADCVAVNGAEHTRPCNENVGCPPDSGTPVPCVGHWTDWGKCSTTCKSQACTNGLPDSCGTQTAKYIQTIKRVGDGAECEAAAGTSRQQGCSSGQQACPVSAVDCQGHWSSWGDCQAACNSAGRRRRSSGKKSRTYTITQATSGHVDSQPCPALHGGQEYGSCSKSCPAPYIPTFSTFASASPPPPFPPTPPPPASRRRSSSFSSSSFFSSSSPPPPPPQGAAAAGRAYAVLGFDTTGDEKIDSFDTTGDGEIDYRRETRRRLEVDEGATGRHRSFFRSLREEEEGEFEQSDPDPYGVAIYGNSTTVAIPRMGATQPHVGGGGHSSRRRMNADDEYVTEEPAANVRYVCSKMSDNAPEQFIPGMAKTRLEQVETCANVETCTKECDFKLDGE